MALYFEFSMLLDSKKIKIWVHKKKKILGIMPNHLENCLRKE